MIVKISIVLAFCVCIKDVSSASFSKVYVQSGPDYPVEYLQYGAPPVAYSQQLARLTSPVSSVISPNYVPCGTPCVYPGQVGSVAPVAPSAQIVQYQAPLPVVVAPARSEPTAYEYSYVVYDDQTGDHKMQKEQSDGNVVRGGYSFLQPDGYVREVQYIADDISGFNAVVKNYIPAITEIKKTESKEPVPCVVVQNEHLTEDPDKKEETVEVHEDKPEEPIVVESIVETHEEKPVAEINVEPVEEVHEETPLVESPHEETEASHEETPHEEAPHEESPHEEAPHEEAPHEETPPVETHEEPPQEEAPHEEAPHEEAPHEEAPHEEAPHEETPPVETHDEVPPPEPAHEEKIEVIQVTPEPGPYIIEDSNESQDTEVGKSMSIQPNILVSYNDIIKCVQSAISGVYEGSTKKPESPLTYIVLNKPC